MKNKILKAMEYAKPSGCPPNLPNCPSPKYTLSYCTQCWATYLERELFLEAQAKLSEVDLEKVRKDILVIICNDCKEHLHTKCSPSVPDMDDCYGYLVNEILSKLTPLLASLKTQAKKEGMQEAVNWIIRNGIYSHEPSRENITITSLEMEMLERSEIPPDRPHIKFKEKGLTPEAKP